MDSSSKGLRLCLTPAVMIAVLVGLTRGRIWVWPGLVFLFVMLVVWGERAGYYRERERKRDWFDLRHSQ